MNRSSTYLVGNDLARDRRQRQRWPPAALLLTMLGLRTHGGFPYSQRRHSWPALNAPVPIPLSGTSGSLISAKPPVRTGNRSTVSSWAAT